MSTGPQRTTRTTRTAGFVLVGLAVTAALAFGVSRLASSEPDGLARVAIDHGLDTGERSQSMKESPFAGYSTRPMGDSGTSKGVAGLVGIAVTFAIAAGSVVVIKTVRRRRRPHRTSPTSAPTA